MVWDRPNRENLDSDQKLPRSLRSLRSLHSYLLECTFVVEIRISSETTPISKVSPGRMPIRKLRHFTVRRFFGAGKTPFGRLTQPEPRARINMRVPTDAIANPPNGTWRQPSPGRESHIWFGMHSHSCSSV